MADDSLFGGILGAVVALKVVDTVFPARQPTRVVYVNQPARRPARHGHQTIRYVRVQPRPRSVWEMQNPFL